MSTEVAVEAPVAALPDAVAIAAKVQENGAAISFPEGFDLATSFGLVPCVLGGQAAAFEYTAEAPGTDTRLLLFEARASYASFAACAQVAAAIAMLTAGALKYDDQDMHGHLEITEWLATIDLPGAEPESDLLRVPVTVVGPRGNTFLQLRLGKVSAGAHLARRLVESIPIEQVPPSLRQPNSRFVLVVRDAHEVVAIEPLGSTGEAEA